MFSVLRSQWLCMLYRASFIVQYSCTSSVMAIPDLKKCIFGHKATGPLKGCVPFFCKDTTSHQQPTTTSLQISRFYPTCNIYIHYKYDRPTYIRQQSRVRDGTVQVVIPSPPQLHATFNLRQVTTFSPSLSNSPHQDRNRETSPSCKRHGFPAIHSMTIEPAISRRLIIGTSVPNSHTSTARTRSIQRSTCSPVMSLSGSLLSQSSKISNPQILIARSYAQDVAHSVSPVNL